MKKEEISIRVSKPEDSLYLTNWLLEPGILMWFPMDTRVEIDDSVRIWMGFIPQGAALTIEVKGIPCGMAVLYLQNYQKVAHQCLFAIIVDAKYRGQGIGTRLCTALIKKAKEEFNIEILHLEVYEGNPAYTLYERLGFKEYGKHPNFLKKQGNYQDKILMQMTL